MNCPKCDAELDFEPADPSVGIECGGWYCEACDLSIAEHEYLREPMEGDVEIPPAPKRPDGKYGIPADLLQGRVPAPDDFEGQVKFDNWKRLCRSWGYD